MKILVNYWQHAETREPSNNTRIPLHIIDIVMREPVSVDKAKLGN